MTTGHDFLSYAVPTIRGELRKHFRDHGWMIRPPRRIQELQARINTAEAELSSQAGALAAAEGDRAAHRRGHGRGDRGPGQRRVLRARLPRPPGRRGRVHDAGRAAALDDDQHRAAEARLMLSPALRQLGERDRLILSMRFYEGLTQREIAARIGVTQMQVSRLLTRILGSAAQRRRRDAAHLERPPGRRRTQHLRCRSCRPSAR